MKLRSLPVISTSQQNAGYAGMLFIALVIVVFLAWLANDQRKRVEMQSELIEQQTERINSQSADIQTKAVLLQYYREKDELPVVQFTEGNSTTTTRAGGSSN